jgi:hypothetical protein
MNLTEALDIIDSGKCFSLQCVSWDKSRKTGGKKKFFSELVACTPKNSVPKNSNYTGAHKNHYDNGTRSCYECIGGVSTASIVTIHINLMLEIDGEKVML